MEDDPRLPGARTPNSPTPDASQPSAVPAGSVASSVTSSTVTSSSVTGGALAGETFAALPPGVTEVARLELREERAFVEKRREQSGQVRVRREVERRTETLTVELLTETVVIEVVSGGSGVFLDGQPLLEGETREIVTYREEASVQKTPVVNEEVRLLKRAVNERREFTVDLGREVLRLEQAAGTDTVSPITAPDEEKL